MKKITFLVLLIVTTGLFQSCEKDEIAVIKPSNPKTFASARIAQYPNTSLFTDTQDSVISLGVNDMRVGGTLFHCPENTTVYLRTRTKSGNGNPGGPVTSYLKTLSVSDTAFFHAYMHFFAVAPGVVVEIQLLAKFPGSNSYNLVGEKELVYNKQL